MVALPGSPRALLVRGGEPEVPSTGDAVMVAHLQGLGLEVTPVLDREVSADDLRGQDLVVISASTLGKVMRDKLPLLELRESSLPIVTCESSTFDLLGLTAPRHFEGASVANGFGSAPGHSTIEIETPGHPLAAGLSGPIPVASSAVALSWGDPSDAAIRVASVGTNRRMAAQFAYERGASMVGLEAPARRVACFISAEAGEVLTAAGWKLFDAGVRWASAP
jgi:hypothetical protein